MRRGGSRNVVAWRRPRKTRSFSLWWICGAFGVGFLAVWALTLVPATRAVTPLIVKPAQRVTPAADLVGRASVIDGDTIRIGGDSVRFNGVDAPESQQTCANEHGATYRCGAESARALDEFLAASRPVRCTPLSRDQYGRVIADCFRADGANVAAWLVRRGHALDWPRFSNGRYASEQRLASAEKRGVWRGSFQNPWEWRALTR